MGGFFFILGIVLILIALGSRFFLPAKLAFLKYGVGFLGALAAFYGVFIGAFFYAEPGFKYHVRTIFGEEKMVRDVGYNTHWWGRVNAWKNAMSVQATQGGNGYLSAEHDGSAGAMSANMAPQTLVFLDQVDARVTATARFQLPEDEEQFLLLARQFRTPENLLRTELIPAFQETLGASASLMAAEEYFSGGRTEFNTEFQNQMQNGIYLVKRREVLRRSTRQQTGSANASLGEDQQEFGDDQQVVFIVEKLLDATGQPRRKVQNFAGFGISLVSARVTNVDPNERFKSRMEQKQDAAAARSVAREQRVQEEEQRLLAISKGEREVAERQAQAKVIQIERTTQAETEKQLAITMAQQRRDQARIEKERAQILLETATIDAEARRVAADAEAYAKQEILKADNALAQKLDAEIRIQELWAAAYAKRQVPQYVFGASGGGVGGAVPISGGAALVSGPPTGSDSETRLLQQLLTMEYAKRLDYDRTLTDDKPRVE
jgi:regulator of protease activity HflC (stomatin/prohibitin superfamily)